ncbi:PAFAH1B1 [Branchiostoma lanceolatum]|uniref:PAFAH1B1 protein n=1 Tax=Branchiostoma lanceolatum TaxID=7740 RepID=A0A8J9ZZH1_BRALA|nr:PAFAH1B1 [Branchiostoma lanceolatum]
MVAVRLDGCEIPPQLRERTDVVLDRSDTAFWSKLHRFLHRELDSSSSHHAGARCEQKGRNTSFPIMPCVVVERPHDVDAVVVLVQITMATLKGLGRTGGRRESNVVGVVGEAGAGKTVLALHVARKLIELGKKDEADVTDAVCSLAGNCVVFMSCRSQDMLVRLHVPPSNVHVLGGLTATTAGLLLLRSAGLHGELKQGDPRADAVASIVQECNCVPAATAFVGSSVWNPKDPDWRVFTGCRDFTIRGLGAWALAETWAFYAVIRRSVCSTPAKDDRLLASASCDCTIRLWDTNRLELSATLTGHEARVTGVAFTLDGRGLVSCSQDGVLKVWEDTVQIPSVAKLSVYKTSRTRSLSSYGSSWNIQKDIAAHSSQIMDLCFYHCSSGVATCAADSLIKLWICRKRIPQNVLAPQGPPGHRFAV